MRSKATSRLVTAMIALGLSAAAVRATGRTTLKSICRVKGQEENTLQGLGFVVGLDGTGDGGSFQPAIRSLAKAMTVMGEPLGKNGLAELKDVKNVALVSVTATVPAAGARQGDKIDCVVSSIGSAKSLKNGRLFLTPLTGPDRNNPRIFAFARGPVTLDDPNIARTGRIHGGCQLEADFFNAFTQDDKISLVLDKNHADFQVAQDVAELINSQLSFEAHGAPLAKAINQFNVEVVIPQQYREDPVMFVSMVLALPTLEPLNQRAGSIVISGDVEIGAVVVAHKNIVIETGGSVGAGQFVPIDVDPQQSSTPRLKALVAALNAVNVPTEDIIDIIKGLDRNGKLHGQLVVED